MILRFQWMRFLCRGTLAVLGAWTCASCGARSGLEGPAPCSQPGAMRPCSGGCGSGTQLCAQGFWQACVPTETVRACADACGSGTESCVDERWQNCQVPDAMRSCSNDCGTGMQACSNGAWAVTCEVPVATRSCNNDCGSGTQTCSDGTWSLGCEVPIATRPCTNDCGTGAQTCSNGTWSLGCEVPVTTRTCSSVCGSGKETCTNSTWGACDAPQPKPPKLVAIIRDFHAPGFQPYNPDFEIPNQIGDGSETGLVLPDLGPDDKPVYANKPGSRTTHGAAYFNQWYNDLPAQGGMPAVNMRLDTSLQLVASATVPGQFEYDNTSFFPIDGLLFGNEGNPHNYHFTLESHTRFLYVGGEEFSFAGDDDMWVFINRRLAIDLGGIHVSKTQSISLDAMSAQLGIVPGQIYPLEFFFAERHTVASDFTIRTTIADAGSCQ